MITINKFRIMSACMIHLVPQSSCFGGIILELLIPLYRKVRDKSIEKKKNPKCSIVDKRNQKVLSTI